MPKDLRGMPDEDFPGYSGVISNLFWRDNDFNRKRDNLAIKLIQEARALTKLEGGSLKVACYMDRTGHTHQT